MRMILGACKRGVAAVVVTHDAQLASWADRVVFLRDGRVVDQTMSPPSPGVVAPARAAFMTTTLERPPVAGAPGQWRPPGTTCRGAVGVAPVPA